LSKARYSFLWILSMTTATVITSPSSHRDRIISCSSETLRVRATEQNSSSSATDLSIWTLGMVRSLSSFDHFFAASFTSA
ncbi:hypothetical protein PENTCL1PPCAC_1468, partial [Pristionchus entomophagus]